MGKLLNIKSFIHESDITIGLANKIAYHFCDRMFTTFSLEGLKKSKRVGSVIDSSANCVDLPFIDNKPVLLITGGSLGAQTLNDFVEKNKNCLLEKFNVIHISGDKKAKIKTTNYWNIDYTKDGLTPFIKSADLIISRAGSNSIFEILNEKKLNILVPLPLSSSRGDQIKNAQYFQEKGYLYIISDDELTMRSFEAAKAYLDTNKDMIYDNLINSNETISTKKFFELIKKEL
ncbi:glycosyltransferase [Listeria aquatica]|uniref:glycosyltransferase n=1 Tax=Listeria aquatica TaxID=1494960 RepID=UPI0031F543BC